MIKPMKRFGLVMILGSAVLLACLLGACNQPTPAPTATPTASFTPAPTLTLTASPAAQTPTVTATPTITPTPTPTITPTPEVLGSTANPLVMGIVLPEMDALRESNYIEIAARLGDQTGAAVQVMTLASYEELLEKLEMGTVHIAWMPPATYVYAHQRGLATVALVTNHYGVYAYGTQLIARVDSGMSTYYDPQTDKVTAPADAAMQQLAGLRPCFVSETSVSGYLVPAGLMRKASAPTREPVFAQSSGGVVRAVYAKDICDFGATYAISGDPRTASAILDQFPDVLSKVMILWRTEAIIPNLNVAFSPNLFDNANPQAVGLRTRLIAAFMALAETEEGRALLGTANDYNIEGFQETNDALYDPLRDLWLESGLSLEPFIGQ